MRLYERPSHPTRDIKRPVRSMSSTRLGTTKMSQYRFHNSAYSFNNSLYLYRATNTLFYFLSHSFFRVSQSSSFLALAPRQPFPLWGDFPPAPYGSPSLFSRSTLGTGLGMGMGEVKILLRRDDVSSPQTGQTLFRRAARSYHEEVITLQPPASETPDAAQTRSDIIPLTTFDHR